MKKQIISILLILLMVLSITGCGEKDKEQTVTSNQEATNSVADVTTDAPTQEPTQAETPTTSNNGKKLVALTFDGAPIESTNEVLKILNKNNVKATFFLVGNNIAYYSDQVKEVYLAGNEIAVNSFYHDSFYELDLETIKKSISVTRDTINFVGAEYSDLVRPPYGEITDEVVNEIDSSIILWDVGEEIFWDVTEDESPYDINKLATVIKGVFDTEVKDGSIIVYPATTYWGKDGLAYIEALNEVLPMLTDEYEFVTVTELFERKGITLEKNKIYNSATN